MNGFDGWEVCVGRERDAVFCKVFLWKYMSNDNVEMMYAHHMNIANQNTVNQEICSPSEQTYPE